MKKEHRDPVTGDLLTKSEWISWKLQQGVIRTWWFLLTFTAITVACVLTFNLSVVGWWNVLASYMAIFVEAIVGRAMFGQTRRDAQIIRELKAVLAEITKVQKTDFQHQQDDYEVSLDINHKLDEVLDRLHDDEIDLPQWWGEYNEDE
jgi:hypothetical protein